MTYNISRQLYELMGELNRKNLNTDHIKAIEKEVVKLVKFVENVDKPKAKTKKGGE